MSKALKVPRGEQIERPWSDKNETGATWWKRKKHRAERRRAKIDPECTPCYRLYRGWSY